MFQRIGISILVGRVLRVFLIGSIACVFFAAAAQAQDSSPLRALETSDESRGWEAVGRLNLDGRSMCTGALIAPDIVLTAAHCLYDRETQSLIDPTNIEFLAGLRHGRASAYRWVRDAVAHPEYVFEPSGRAQVNFDIAILRLESPIRNTTVTPFAIDQQPAKGENVGVVSYARGRAETPAIEETCRVLARRFGTLILSCSVDFGASGAPVFRIENGVARIVSVVSAKAELDDRQVALSTSLDGQIERLLAEMAARPQLPNRPAGNIVRLNGSASQEGATRGTTGAKFLRP